MRRRPARQPRPRRRTWLGLRARLTLTGLSLLVLSGALLLLVMNMLIALKLSSIYSRPLVMIYPDSPISQMEQWRRAKQEANAYADQAAATVRVTSLVAFAVIIAMATVTYWLVAGRALRPLREITTVAGRLSQETLGQRIAFAGPEDEVKQLADSFDAMLARLERAFDAQRLFVANASHELRGPLTVARTAADLALSRRGRPEEDYRKALDTVVTATQRSQRLLDSLLRLARTQNRAGAAEPVDLAAVTRTLLGDGSPPGPTLRAALHPALTQGDPVLVERLVRNLLDNALRYTPADGWVRIRTGQAGPDGPDGQAAELEIENTGRVITAEQALEFLQPFHRGERTQPADGEGFGLGLAIAEAVAYAHAGHLRIAPRADGGLRVTVTLPRHQQEVRQPRADARARPRQGRGRPS